MNECVHLRSLKLVVFQTTIAVNSISAGEAAGADHLVLKPDSFSHYIERFNTMENENWTNFVSNADSWAWLRANIPFFECPDAEVEETYYFRWWSFRKHLRQTPDGFVFTEFLVPVRHAGIHNTISCAVGHHVAEARWLRNQRYVDDYILFWLRGHGGKPQPHFHQYSSWFAAAVYDRDLVTPDAKFLVAILEDLAADFQQWEKERRLENGLFWQYDVRDGMEESISGARREKNARPTINSYMFGNAQAIAAIARLAGRSDLANEYDRKAAEIKRLTQALLWDEEGKFFKVRSEKGQLSDAREAIGFVPWCFNLPDAATEAAPGAAERSRNQTRLGETLVAPRNHFGQGIETAWAQLMDPEGFCAPYGITTAERRHPKFRSHGCCGCEWDGAVWPFATSQTLTALANVLHEYRASTVTPRDYFEAFLTSVRSHRFQGKPYIGEYLDEMTGHWLKGAQERSRYYNHSTFADLLITGVIGLRPRADNQVEIHPLLPDRTWEWFCLDGVQYHGRSLTIVWDRDGKRYHRGQGLTVLADGKVITRSDRLGPVAGKLQ
ncbi:MAG: glycoside hydrolase [Verrucomicrobia bacterium]|nr:glycoside hydrolase [Verrucomicrobiota bacterium]